MTLAAVFQAPANQPVVNVNGRSYTVTGPTITIPYPDAASVQLPMLQVQGATADRPTYNPDGGHFGAATGGVPLRMFDTTLGEMIFLANPGQPPAAWINAAGSAV